MRMLRLPSPAIVVAAAALLVALTGTAFAAQQIVPLAKRALIADKAKVALNARRLGGQTSGALVRRAVSQASTTRGPASTAADLVVVKNQAAGQIGAGAGKAFSISCDAGQKIVSAGFLSDGPVLIAVGSYPTSDTSWTMGLLNLDGANPANVTMFATCLK
jgi:hypothetical protein